jgi:catechol 2,3-dioxygenase-like lactoylglutathione lyase family enzyme
MQPRITLIILGVDDVERAVRFYRDGLGLKTEGIVGTEFEQGAIAFFDLQAGLKLALWPRRGVFAPPPRCTAALANQVELGKQGRSIYRGL